MIEKIVSKIAPVPIGPYAQAIRSGDLLFCSGQTPVDPQTMLIETNDVTTQTHRAIRNLELVLEGAGLTLRHVVKTTVFLTDMNQFAAMNKVYGECFGDHTPARTTIAVRELPLKALVEIECIASFTN